MREEDRVPPIPQRLMGLCPGCVAIGDYMPFLAARSLAWGFVSARTMLREGGGGLSLKSLAWCRAVCGG